MIQDETIRCPYWKQGKCTAVPYPLNCNYQAGFIQCSKYIEQRVNEIESRDSQEVKPNSTAGVKINEKASLQDTARVANLYNPQTPDTHTLLGKVIPKDMLRMSIEEQNRAKQFATGRLTDITGVRIKNETKL